MKEKDEDKRILQETQRVIHEDKEKVALRRENLKKDKESFGKTEKKIKAPKLIDSRACARDEISAALDEMDFG